MYVVFIWFSFTFNFKIILFYLQKNVRLELIQNVTEPMDFSVTNQTVISTNNIIIRNIIYNGRNLMGIQL